MKVLMVEPGKSPYAAEIESGLQPSAGGSGWRHFRRSIHRSGPGGFSLCSDEGKLMGLPLNRALFDDDGHVYHIVSGNFPDRWSWRGRFYRPFPGCRWRNTGSSLSTLKNFKRLPIAPNSRP